MRNLASLMAALILSCAVMGQSARPKKTVKHHKAAQAGPVNQPAALATPGSGTQGHLAKWINSSNLGDSSITEDKSGNVGIAAPAGSSALTVGGAITATGPVGIAAPAGSSALTVGGVIESLTGGIKFPDGSIQTRAATLNHDQTLKGDGAGNPLGLAVPLIFTGFVEIQHGGVITVTNSAPEGTGIVTTGADANTNSGFDGGRGLVSHGGRGISILFGGDSLVGLGGNGEGFGGTGGLLFGGDAIFGGDGLIAQGGQGHNTGSGGSGIIALPGKGVDGAAHGLAGDFRGDVSVTGTLSKGGGSFKIDHPLDPANKYLYHSFVESPDMKNIYDGVITLDAAGEAIVELPEWFGALNRDFRYLLTAIGAPGPTLYIAEEVNGNHFKIAGGSPRMKVSWQVTGIRQDAWANAHRIPVEEEKPGSERGYYLYPELFGQPEQKNVQWARHPEAMKRIKEARDHNKPAQGFVNQ
jgi:hypothetical protein